MAEAMTKRRSSRLKPGENDFYVGRDMDNSLYIYESLPEWTGFDFVVSDPRQSCRLLQEDWFPSLEPGWCVKLTAVGNLIDMRSRVGGEA